VSLVSRTVEVRDKYTGEVIAELEVDSLSSFREKVRRAHESRERIASTGLDDRLERVREIGREIRNRSEEIVDLMVREAGQPVKYARWEARVTYGNSMFFDALIDKVRPKEVESFSGKSYVYRTPMGVVAAITPRNAPLVLPAYSLFSSYGGGNATVLKPSMRAPLTTLKLAELAGDIVEVAVYPGAEAAKEFIHSPLVDAIVIYANSHVGKELMIEMGKYLESTKQSFMGGFFTVAGKMKKYVPELAGNDPMIILEVEDLEKIADIAVKGGYSNAGQMCVSSKRYIVHESVYGELRELMVDKISKLKVGDPRDESTDIGPIGNKLALDLAEYQLSDTVASGGRVLVGGKREDPFFYPTLVELDSKTALERKPLLWVEECFAPVRSIVKFSSMEEAIALANSTSYGLRASIYGPREEAEYIASRLDVGMVVINEDPFYNDIFAPFGGMKDSGIGGAKYLIEELTNVKYVHIGEEV